MVCVNGCVHSCVCFRPVYVVSRPAVVSHVITRPAVVYETVRVPVRHTVVKRIPDVVYYKY
jgi:hypothetical protein